MENINIQNMSSEELESILKKLSNLEVRLEYEIKDKKAKVDSLIGELKKDDSLSEELLELVARLDNENISEDQLEEIKKEIESITERNIQEFNELLNKNENLIKSLFIENK